MHISRALRATLVLCACASWILAESLQAQVPARAGETLRAIKGPPRPVSPEVETRDERGGATIRATKLTESLQLDGRLDEHVYQDVKPVTGFYQVLPDAGLPATEDTDIWILFDSKNVYVGARCWQKDMKHTLVANEMRRDKARENDNFGVAFDTFYDRQSGFMFSTSPIAAQGDGQVGEGPGVTNTDFNPIWEVRTGRFEGGWTVEMRVPFKTLRYRPGVEQVWGVQFRRVIRYRSETAFFTKMPITVGTGGIGKLSYAATLVGIEVPPRSSKNIEIKPYGISRMTSDRTVSPAISTDATGDAGLDLKYGLTQNLSADLTFNTDFAQVEVDDQQVNLTRFNLVFPEKREFFLEGAGTFAFAGGSSNTNAPQVFFSRRIGIEGGRVAPILGGARAQGKVGRYSIGLLSMQTDREPVGGVPRTNFTVARVKRDVFRKSSMGVMLTSRSVSTVAPGGSNQTYGVDSAFSFFDDLDITGYYADSRTPGRTTRTNSYQATFGWSPDLYGFTVDHLYIGDAFNPEVGFVRRGDMRRTFSSARFSPRPAHNKTVRRYVFTGDIDYIQNSTGRLDSRNDDLAFDTEFQNSDKLSIGATRSFDRLVAPFRIASGVTIPAGEYDFNTVRASYAIGPQKRWHGTLAVERGTFYGGDHSNVVFSSGRFALTPQFSLEPSLSVNWADLPYGSFTTTVLRSRVNYTFTPRTFVAGLVQYNSTTKAFSTNVRLRWEYALGSELFVVLTEDRPTDQLRGGFSQPLNRAFVVKINRLLRF